MNALLPFWEWKTPIKWRLLLFGPLPVSLCPYPTLAWLSWQGLILKGSGTGLRDKSSKGIGNLQVTELRAEARDCTGALCAYAEGESHPVVPRLEPRQSAVRLAIHERTIGSQFPHDLWRQQCPSLREEVAAKAEATPGLLLHLLNNNWIQV